VDVLSLRVLGYVLRVENGGNSATHATTLSLTSLGRVKRILKVKGQWKRGDLHHRLVSDLPVGCQSVMVRIEE
jgi:hypothetical protein